MYFAQFGKYLSSQVNYRKILSLHKERHGFSGKIHDNKFGGPSIVFTTEAALKDFLLRDSPNWYKTIDGNDACRLYPYSMCQAMPTGPYSEWELDSAFGELKPSQNETSCRHYYTHENKKLLQRCQLVATTEDLTEFRKPLGNTDVTESCTRERAKTKWKLYKLKNNTIFAALLEEVPMGFKDDVLLDLPMKNLMVSFLTFEKSTRKPYKDNSCLFWALELHLHGTEGLGEETSKLFNPFQEKTGATDPANFWGMCMEDMAAVENIDQEDILMSDIDIVDESDRQACEEDWGELL